MQFTWDQVQNAWVMKDMLIDHRMPLEGMVAKLNSGFRIGPAYYYLLAPFYWLFAMDPIAGGVFAGIVAVGTFLVLFFVVKNLFSVETALVAAGIYTFSAHSITHDQIPWPVIFIPLTSLLIFYFLVRILGGRITYLPYLAFTLGFSLHVHFTAIFFFLIVLLSFPWIVRIKHFWKYTAISVPLFILWIIPMIITSIASGNSTVSSIFRYASEYYHGFHFVRVFQLIGDAFIEFGSVIGIKEFIVLKYITLPLFIYLYFQKYKVKQAIRFCLLLLLWFLIPLVVFSLYKGEITDYYFALTRLLVIMVYAFITVDVFKRKNIVISIFLCIFWLYFIIHNLGLYTRNTYSNLPHDRVNVNKIIEAGGKVNFTEGDPKSYLYYIYGERKK